MKQYLLLLGVALTIWSCRSNKEVVYGAEVDEQMLDTLTVVAQRGEGFELPRYNAAAERKIDLTQIQLRLKFDWEQQAVLGKAVIYFSPVFYEQDSVVLDAVGFDIEKITSSNARKELAYNYDGRKLRIALDKTLTRDQTGMVVINYTAYPNRNPESGSAAITSDKGLFFIDPLDKDPNKPSQIWTQGETENNSRWFPVIDKPNERLVQDIFLTVDSNYVTLSNGKFIGSLDHKDGTRTDRWFQEKPHAPYLFMVAVGDFAVVEETWKHGDSLEIPLSYYVEHDYEPYAKEIFNHTPEMLTFFSDLLDYPYPWDKYAQIVTRDYVSGAMENTSAVIFGDFVQKTDRELIDNDNDYIVAHEMFHHWFGDLVTCENWANLTLNEGFANYSEYLWMEYKYGLDRAEAHRLDERNGYLQSTADGIHPLIHYSYEDKEEMFDAHSYNKGGLVLHMLRDYIGDDAFFAGLNKYLVDNAYSAVEVDELRMAFEDITGLDLQWFFNQWYHSEGHPKLEVSYGQNLESELYSVVVSQTQEGDDVLPVYRLPLDIALWDTSGKKHLYHVEMRQRDQLFLLDVDYPVAFATIDDGSTVLAEIIEEKSQEEYVAQASYETNYIDRMAALMQIQGTPAYTTLLPTLLRENYWKYRLLAVEGLDIKLPDTQTQLAEIAQNDPHSIVRSMAIARLAEAGYAEMPSLATSVLAKEQAYPPLSNALRAQYQLDASKALTYIKGLDYEEKKAMLGAIADIYAAEGDAQYVEFFEEHLTTVDIYQMFDFYAKYRDMLAIQEPDAALAGAEKLAEIASGEGGMYRKYAATSNLSRLYKDINKRAGALSDGPKKTQMIETGAMIQSLVDFIKNNETNPNLIAQYKGM